MISEEVVNSALSQIKISSKNNNTDLFCTTRDIFQARVDAYVNRTNKYLESAVIGEIGNNTFDHNWNYEEGQTRGSYFNPNFMEKYVVLADFGRGIRDSLAKVIKADTDTDAVRDAFTKHISGRAPEQRGNGLKFVSESIASKKWSLYFQSGNGCCIIDNGLMRFVDADFSIIGCIAILQF